MAGEGWDCVQAKWRFGHFRPGPCNESVDSLHALHTQHFFGLLRPGSCNESGDSLHHMGHFFDFCPNPCNESVDSLRAVRTHCNRVGDPGLGRVVWSEQGAVAVRADVVQTLCVARSSRNEGRG
jgi:hypothetical protein